MSRCACRGMTEMSPLGTMVTLKPEYADLKGEERLDIKQKQGQSPFGVEMKITDDAEHPLPWDGKTFGRLSARARGAKAYYQGGHQFLDSEGSSIPATSPPSTVTATCRSPTAPRT